MPLFSQLEKAGTPSLIVVAGAAAFAAWHDDRKANRHWCRELSSVLKLVDKLLNLVEEIKLTGKNLFARFVHAEPIYPIDFRKRLHAATAGRPFHLE